MIRPFSPSDLESLLQIENQSFPKSPYDPITFHDLHVLSPETFLVFVGPSTQPDAPGSTSAQDSGAVEEGPINHDQTGEKILGYIIFSRDGHIISIAVHPHHRKRGIGKELLQKAMRTSCPESLWAEVRRSNQGAQAFYFSVGFQMQGVAPNYYGNEDALIVAWARRS